MEKTLHQYDEVINECRALFSKKLKDYGTAWRILRLSSVTDQIYIKANRIRSIQQNQVKKVDEDERGEFIAIINYSIIGLTQMQLGVVNCPDISAEEALAFFDQKAQEAKDLMERKNHDYGEAWRDMRVSSITDLILQKILRIKQIEDNKGKTLVSEGYEGNYYDMLNYAVFSMIHINEFQKQTS